MSSSTGLLVVSNIKKISTSIRALEKNIYSLYIHLNLPQVDKSEPAPVWGRLIAQIYADSVNYTDKKTMDMRILIEPLKNNNIPRLKHVDKIYSDSHLPEICDNLRSVLNIRENTIFLENLEMSNDISDNMETKQTAMYDTVVLGGTFDRIHLGHKILLSHAVIRANKRLVVGVTTEAMTKSKVLPELILPVEQRISEVRDYLMDIDGSLQYDIVPIDDPFGPTQHDPNIDMIVVSAETLRGGQKVNEIRAAKKLKPLEIFVVDIVETKEQKANHEIKVSSSNARIELLGTRLRQVVNRPNLSAVPYIIGLTGGIASGKTRMSERLANLGAHVIDCDKVAHEIYEPGQACYNKIITHFGSQILASDKKIDRTKLGPIVFGDSKQLETLNSIVWPELMEEVKRRLSTLRNDREKRPKIVVLEAAVLHKAGWDSECHEVWSIIVPPDEAVRRICERNKLSEEQARQRICSQLSNSEIVAKSHVVFSSQWDYDFTQTQIEKAWRMLNDELDSKKLQGSV